MTDNLRQQPLAALKSLKPQFSAMLRTFVAEMTTVKSFVERHQVNIWTGENSFRRIWDVFLCRSNGLVVSVKLLTSFAKGSKRDKNWGKDAAPTKFGNEIVETRLIDSG